MEINSRHGYRHHGILRETLLMPIPITDMDDANFLNRHNNSVVVARRNVPTLKGALTYCKKLGLPQPQRFFETG